MYKRQQRLPLRNTEDMTDTQVLDITEINNPEPLRGAALRRMHTLGASVSPGEALYRTAAATTAAEIAVKAAEIDALTDNGRVQLSCLAVLKSDVALPAARVVAKSW